MGRPFAYPFLLDLFALFASISIIRAHKSSTLRKKLPGLILGGLLP